MEGAESLSFLGELTLKIGEENWMPAARGNFQAGQTAKAQRGLPCAVTPEWDVAAGKLAHRVTWQRKAWNP